MKPETTPFAWKDWSHDLMEHPLEIEGAWIRICCKLHYAEPRGLLERKPEQWAGLLGVTVVQAKDILRYMKENRIGIVSMGNNGHITVGCRRMMKEEKAKIHNRIRQKRFRESNKEINSNAREVINYLNEKVGRRFSNYDQIAARLKEGGTVEQCKHIIDTKLCDPYFQANPNYYNPVTLFRKCHWDKYTNEKPSDFRQQSSDMRPSVPYVKDVVIE